MSMKTLLVVSSLFILESLLGLKGVHAEEVKVFTKSCEDNSYLATGHTEVMNWVQDTKCMKLDMRCTKPGKKARLRPAARPAASAPGA